MVFNWLICERIAANEANARRFASSTFICSSRRYVMDLKSQAKKSFFRIAVTKKRFFVTSDEKVAVFWSCFEGRAKKSQFHPSFSSEKHTFSLYNYNSYFRNVCEVGFFSRVFFFVPSPKGKARKSKDKRKEASLQKF